MNDLPKNLMFRFIHLISIVFFAFTAINAQAQTTEQSPPDRIKPGKANPDTVSPTKRADAKQACIFVQMTGFSNDIGEAIVSLHSSAKSFPSAHKTPNLRKVKISKGKANAQFCLIAPGQYAIAVIHDENMDGKLAFSWWPYPHVVEAAGMSHNVRPLFGPPDFDDAKFIFKNQDVTLKIKMLL